MLILETKRSRKYFFAKCIDTLKTTLGKRGSSRLFVLSQLNDKL